MTMPRLGNINTVGEACTLCNRVIRERVSRPYVLNGSELLGGIGLKSKDFVCRDGVTIFKKNSFAEVRNLYLWGKNVSSFLRGIVEAHENLMANGYVTSFAEGSKTKVGGDAFLMASSTYFQGDFSGKIAKISKHIVIGKNAKFDRAARASLPWRFSTLAAKLLPKHWL